MERSRPIGTKIVSHDGSSFAIVKKHNLQSGNQGKFYEKDPLSITGEFNSQNESEALASEQDPLSIEKRTIVKEEINFGSDDYAYLRMAYSDAEPMTGNRDVQVVKRKSQVTSVKKRPIKRPIKKKLSVAMTKTIQVSGWKLSFHSYCTDCHKRWNQVHYKSTESCPSCKVRLAYRCNSCGKHYFARSGASYHVKYACGRSRGDLSCTYPNCPYKTKDPEKLEKHQKLKHLFFPSSDPLQLIPAETNEEPQSDMSQSKFKNEDLSNAILPDDPLALSPTKNVETQSPSKTQRLFGPKILSVSIVRQDSMLSNLFKPAGKPNIVPINPQDPLLSPTDSNKKDDEQADIKPERESIDSEDTLPPIPPLKIINQSVISQSSGSSLVPFSSAKAPAKASKKARFKVKSGKFSAASKSALKCSKCSVQFTIKSWYRNHARYCGTSYRLFECHHCQFNTLYKRKIRKHVQKHVDRSDYYKCPRCDKSYKHRKHLTAHMKHACNPTVEFQCDLCAYKCFIKPYMIKHMRYKHEVFSI
ncbi:hypothetical protein QAD02_022631 [Eretmocerus hayati]|uniref:Uncharacterized protein n=1 Tax=Eretmocerus hayati TaxID=131215 RepID=A0ACC2PTV4_9HYME|nr:hypothetical protein QAD02_022631 [Eretmocerus hayati]